jgi:hypothetical protein
VTSPADRELRRQHLLVAGAFLVIALVQTWPLVTELSRVLPNDLGDPILNTWILWWNAQVVPLTTRWWDAPMFFPSRGTLAFSEVLLGLSLFATPLQWLGASPVFAYNLLLLLSFQLCAFCTYLLAWSLTRRTGPSIVAGCMYGYAVIRYPHLSHIQFQWTWWMPLALLGLHRWLTERRVPALVLFAGAWLGQSLSNGYYFFYFSVIVGLWILWFTPWRDARRALVPVLAAWAVAVAMMAPVLLTYQAIHERYQFTRTIGEVENGSADLTDFFRLSSVPRFLHVAPWERPECQVSLPIVGLCALAFALASGARGGLRRRGSRPLSIAHGLWWVVALAYVLLIIVSVMIGTRHIGLFGVRVGGIPKLIAMAVPLVLIAIAASPAAQQAWRARSATAFYLGAVAVSIVLAMGPYPRVMGARIWDQSPYLALMTIVPGFAGLRMPARFTLVAVLCLAILTALVLARIRLAGVWRERVVFGAIVMAALLETWPGPFRLPDLPPAGPDLASAATVLELPYDAGQGLPAIYRSMFHARPVIDGYSGYFPPSFFQLAVCFNRKELECVDRLRRLVGSIDMVIERSKDPSGQWEDFTRSLPEAQFRGRYPGFAVYHLPGRVTLRLDEASNFAHVPVKAMTSTIAGTPTAPAYDGDPATVWSTGRGQQANDSVTIEAAQAAPIAGVELVSGPDYAQNFPIALIIETSDDGQQWTRAWEGATDDVRFAMLMTEGVHGCRIAFPPRQGRFVRLTETATHAQRSWVIAELAILRPR